MKIAVITGASSGLGVEFTKTIIKQYPKVLHFTIYVSDETLGTALHRLSEKQRSAILLRYFQGMNDREISELYHVSRSAIFSRISRGLKKLKTLLSERK